VAHAGLKGLTLSLPGFVKLGRAVIRQQIVLWETTPSKDAEHRVVSIKKNGKVYDFSFSVGYVTKGVGLGFFATLGPNHKWKTSVF